MLCQPGVDVGCWQGRGGSGSNLAQGKRAALIHGKYSMASAGMLNLCEDVSPRGITAHRATGPNASLKLTFQVSFILSAAGLIPDVVGSV